MSVSNRPIPRLPRGSSTRTSRPRAANVDDFGDTVGARASGSEPRRIVSLNPTTTEILFAIGAGSRLVGRTHWDVFPDSAIAVPDLGNGLRPNVEAVLSAHPDLYHTSHGSVRLAIHDGSIALGSLEIPGFASGAEPDWATLEPMQHRIATNEERMMQ